MRIKNPSTGERLRQAGTWIVYCDEGGLLMCEYPELREFIEGFAARYTRRIEIGLALAATDEELRAFSEFLVQGLIEWVEASGSSDALDEPALGKVLEAYADRRARGSDVGASVEVSEDEIIGLGLFLTRGLVGWVL